MPFQSAQAARVLIGNLSASAYTRSLGVAWNVEQLDITTLADKAKVFINGQDTSTFQADGPLDTDASAASTQINTLIAQKAAANFPITFGFDGLTIGSRVWMLNAIQAQLTTSSAETGTADWACNAQTDGFTSWNGVTLSDLIAITTTTNGTAVDNGAATANGGYAHLHVTAYSGLTSNTVTIEHSTTGIGSWVTLATFTAATAITSQRVVVAAGTAVSQYLRVVDTAVGVGSNTRIAAFARG